MIQEVGKEISSNALFVDYLLDVGVLKFGDFTLKSGRKSPYFFNLGSICSGLAMRELCANYARVMVETPSFVSGNLSLFGPAYKGIPLITGISLYLGASYASSTGQDLSFSYNRKEVKSHGEGGILAGYDFPEPRDVLIIEDVCTAGTSIHETMSLLQSYPNANVIGLVVAIDRQERMESGKTALQELSDKYGIGIASIINIDQVIDAIYELKARGSAKEVSDAQLQSLVSYRNKNCVRLEKSNLEI